MACDIGIGVKLSSDAQSAYTSSVLDFSSGAQELFSTVDGSELYVSANERFNLVTLNVSQAGTGGVYTYEYFNGSGYQTLLLIATPSFSATGQTVLAFQAPLDWSINGAGQYAIRLTATTAPATEVQATTLSVVRTLALRREIGSNLQLGVLFKTRSLLLQSGEEIIPYFSIANAGNTVEIAYQLNG